MAYNAITNAEIQVKQPGRQELMQKIKDNFDHLYGTMVGFVGVNNGSFEIDSDADGVPDSWTRTLYSGGSGGYDTVTPVHGAKTYKFVHPGGAGNGGGYLESDYILAGWLAYYFGFLLKCTVAGIKVQVIIRCFDAAKVTISQDQTIYNSTANPTSWGLFSAQVALPTDTRYVKIKIVGGHNDTDVAGTVYFDNIIFNEVVAASGLKMGTSTWSINIPASSFSAVNLPEYSHFPKQTGANINIKLWASTAVLPYGTEGFYVIAENTSGTAAVWSGTCKYHSDSEQIIVVTKDDAGKITGVCVTEKGNENCIRSFDKNETELPLRCEILTRHNEADLFDIFTQKAKYKANEILAKLSEREKNV